MWEAVHQLNGRQTKHRDGVTADSLNAHYASILTDPEYIQPNLKHTVNKPDLEYVSEWSMFNALDTLHATATGLDEIRRLPARENTTTSAPYQLHQYYPEFQNVSSLDISFIQSSFSHHLRLTSQTNMRSAPQVQLLPLLSPFLIQSLDCWLATTTWSLLRSISAFNTQPCLQRWLDISDAVFNWSLRKKPKSSPKLQNAPKWDLKNDARYAQNFVIFIANRGRRARI